MAVMIDPELVMTRGTNIKKVYDKYDALLKEINEIKERVGDAWEGADSAGYITAIDNYKPDFDKLGECLQELGTVIYKHGSRTAESRDRITHMVETEM